MDVRFSKIEMRRYCERVINAACEGYYRILVIMFVCWLYLKVNFERRQFFNRKL